MRSQGRWWWWGAVALLIGMALLLGRYGAEARAAAEDGRGFDQYGMIRLNAASVQSFKDFFAVIGATELGAAPLHKARCEANEGHFAGRWRGPTGVELSFCATMRALDPAADDWLCAGFANLSFVAIELPHTLVCAKRVLGADEDKPQGEIILPLPETRLHKIGSLRPPADAGDPVHGQWLLDFNESFPARECRRRAALHKTITVDEQGREQERQAQLEPLPWSFALNAQGHAELTCWQPEVMLPMLDAAQVKALREPPEGWAPLPEEQMDALCQRIFGERLAPVYAEPLTPAIAQRRYVWLKDGRWWCGKAQE